MDTAHLWAIDVQAQHAQGNPHALRLWARCASTIQAALLADDWLSARHYRCAPDAIVPELCGSSSPVACDGCTGRDWPEFLRPTDDDGKPAAVSDTLSCGRCSKHVAQEVTPERSPAQQRSDAAMRSIFGDDL